MKKHQLESYFKRISIKRLEFVANFDEITHEDICTLKLFYIVNNYFEKAAIMRDFEKISEKKILIIESDFMDRYGTVYIPYMKRTESFQVLFKKLDGLNLKEKFKQAKI